MTETIAAPSKPRRKAPLILAGTLVLALLAGAGWLVLSMLRGATPAAAKGLPNSALAVVEVNLKPSAESQLAAKEFVEKFPILADRFKDVGTDYKAALYNFLTVDASETPDFAEVSAWLGDSMAVGAVPDPTEPAGPERVLPVMSVEITNKDKALAFVNEHMSGYDPIIMDNLMVLAPAELSLTADWLGDNSIADLSEYNSDLSKLGDDNLATAWISEKFVETTMDQQSAAAFPKVRTAMGLTIKDGTLSLRSIATTAEGVTVDGNVRDVAAGLPANTAVAGAISIPKEFADQLWSIAESAGENSMSSVGITSVEDLRTLLGTEITFTLDSSEPPTAALAVRSDNPVKQQLLLGNLLQQAGATPAASVIEEDRVITTFRTTTESFTSPSEKLGDNATYQKLTAGIDNPHSILWVDGNKLKDLVQNLTGDTGLAENLQSITGIGVVSQQLDANTSEGWLRISTS